MRSLALLVALAMVACSTEPAPAPVLPPSVVEHPTPPALAPAEDLERVLPRLNRDGSLAWRHRSKRIPGHFSAHLYTTAPERSLMIVTVDDLQGRPERVAWFQSLPTHIGSYKGQSVSPDWIRALVANRYEVMVRADHDEFRSHGKLAHWFDKLRTSELKALQKATLK